VFTGIVEAVGRIDRVERRGQDERLAIQAGGMDLSDVAVGDSIAVNGVCLTVTAKKGRMFYVDVSRETLNCTAGLDAPGEVNLERALRLSDRLGGHLVSGHVDGVGEVLRFQPAGECFELGIRAPGALARYIAHKGSIAVNGVSLTVNRVNGHEFSTNLIPHTLEATNLKHLAPGKQVNLEVDLVARYLERMLQSQNPSDKD
jgi:riboflavin synthase